MELNSSDRMKHQEGLGKKERKISKADCFWIEVKIIMWFNLFHENMQNTIKRNTSRKSIQQLFHQRND
jgi:hypothetical protein